MSGIYHYIYSNPLIGIVLFIFWLWMFIDAIRRGEWLWAVFMFFFAGLTTLLYFFMVYRATASAMQGFELPGAARRHRIKELETLIHDLDKPHHYLELGDIYFQKGNLTKAEACYRASLQRDPQDIDARAHLGQCLLRQKRAGEALSAFAASLHRESQARLRSFPHGLCRDAGVARRN